MPNEAMSGPAKSLLSLPSISLPTPALAWLAGSLLLWLVYAAVFIQTVATPPAQAFTDAAANVLPLALLAAAAHALVDGRVVRLSPARQIAAHASLAILFAAAWYGSVVLLQALWRAAAGGPFVLIGFSGPGLTWQVFQGLILYALVATATYALRAPPRLERDENGGPLERYLTRRGDAMVPVHVRDIATITGAQDYAEVATREGRHLVRMSLGEFEKRLDPALFKRVHRSAIINLDHLSKAEPAGGGRMIARMANGDSVPVSRSGALLLRSLAV